MPTARRSEEHTSELQSRPHLVCRLLTEKKNAPRRTPAAPSARTLHALPGTSATAARAATDQGRRGAPTWGTTPGLSSRFFFAGRATPQISTLSLHDALPIYQRGLPDRRPVQPLRVLRDPADRLLRPAGLCQRRGDRKSTRLNSSHVRISYAVS